MTDTATLLPPNATPLERAAGTAAANISAIPAPIRSIWNPYTCPEALLPWLAYAMAVDEWDDTWPANTKRDVIAQSLQVKRVKGTYGSVQSAIEAMGLPARVQEWYQQAPAADPYTFRLVIEADQTGFNQQQIGSVRSVVAKTKNLRSHLDGIDLSMRSLSGLSLASATATGIDSTVEDGTPRYADGTTALDLLVDGAVNGDNTTADATDQLRAIVQSMPTKLSIPTDL